MRKIVLLFYQICLQLSQSNRNVGLEVVYFQQSSFSDSYLGICLCANSKLDTNLL